jgi:parvulin-like peptidyl-prolyl isomerase
VIASPAPPPAPPPPPQSTDLDSHDILDRTTVTSPVLVKHVLIGWAELEKNYGGRLDPRAAKRTQAEAARLALEVAGKLRRDPGSIDALAEKHSEDPGSLSKDPYSVTTESAFVPAFKNLAQRLDVNEVGIVQTLFGYHVVIRVAPPPPDPLESADILARPASAGPVDVQHILIGWQGLTATRDPRAQGRTKDQADSLASEILAKVRAGGDMAALMKKYSEDPGTGPTGKPYTVAADSPMVEPFKQLSLRLNIGEAGLVKTTFGWHIIKRIAPPPPDSLESVAILKRTTTAEKVKVKHILLGWKDAHAEDPRGAARTRAELEKLVKATLARLAKKGAKIEPLMAELSEDPGSAKTGDSYDVTPNAALVKPFLELSLRLELNEVGVVKTEYGIHIIKRVE